MGFVCPYAASLASRSACQRDRLAVFYDGHYGIVLCTKRAAPKGADLTHPRCLARRRSHQFCAGSDRTTCFISLFHIHAARYGLHGIRSEAFVTCSGAVDEETAAIHGGWASVATASRYDRVTMPVAKSIASKMVAFHFTASDPGGSLLEASRSPGDVGVVANRAAARSAGNVRPPRHVHQPSTLPAGWQRVWHPTAGRRAGYATFEGPNGVTASSIREARALAQRGPVPSPARAAASVAAPGPSTVFPDDLADHVVFADRPSTRPPPRTRIV